MGEGDLVVVEEEWRLGRYVCMRVKGYVFTAPARAIIT